MVSIEQILRRTNVFVIDDSEYIAQTLKKVLSNLECNVLGYAINADQAMAKIQELKNEIHLVTLDIFLGNVDGMTLIPQILAINPNIKIIMVSSNKDEKLIMKCIMLGAKHYIIKPFNIDDVKRIIYQVAAQQKIS